MTYTARQLLLKIVWSLVLCDHIGDVADDVAGMLKILGVEGYWGDLHEVSDLLDREEPNVSNLPSLHETEVWQKAIGE